MKNKSMIVLCLFVVLQISATIINIPQDQLTIQAGIDATVDSDTVLVQPGTYIENINFNGKSITVGSMYLTIQDTSFISNTIIDGNSSGSVVTFESSEDSTSVLCGFTITNGSSSSRGGGIYCDEASPNLENLIISNNSTVWYGGGICLSSSEATLTNLIISNNNSDRYGGGISFGVSNSNLENVTIKNNTTNWDGGGVAFFGNCNPNFVNVTIKNNAANCDGGGIYCENSNPSLKKVVIYNNSAEYGGGISLASSNPYLENLTICNNTAEYGGGGIHLYLSDPNLINCILWDNTPQEIYFSALGFYPNSISISYSDVAGGLNGIITNNNGTIYWLEGNIQDYPMFSNPTNEDYHLNASSPCIDAGHPNSPLDPDGTIADMGAYYFHQEVYIEDYLLHVSKFDLSNHPNPFNPSTTIEFSISDDTNIELSIYNIKGQKVKQLISDQLSAGQHSIIWNSDNDFRKPVNSGIYFYKLKVNGNTEAVKKCLLLK
jgi:hypothetical protein